MTIDDYIHYYPFDNSLEDIKGSNNLTQTNNSIYAFVNNGATNTDDKEGNPNNAVAFNGTSSYMYTTEAMPSHTTASMSFWFLYLGDWDSRNQILATWHNARLTFGYLTTSDTILITTDASGARSANYDTLVTGWNHIVVTRDNTTYKCYINGNETTYGGNNYWSSTDTKFLIGRRAGTANNYYEGSLDSIRLYDRVLNQTEVTSLYNESSDVTGYIARWDFDNGDLINPYSLEYVDDRNLNNNSAVNFGEGSLSGIRLETSTTINNNIISASMWYKYVDNVKSENVILNSSVTHYNHLIIDNSTKTIGVNDGGVLKSSTLTLTSGNWYHIVLIKNSTNTKIYVDNVLYLSTTAFENNTYPIEWIGNGQTRTTVASDALDDLKIYDFELTIEQIQELYELSDIIDPPVISISLNGSKQAYLSWGSVSEASNYHIYRYTNNNSEYSSSDELNFESNAELIASTSSTNYTDTEDLDRNVVYYYAVKAES